MEIKTIEQARELGLRTHSFKNGTGEYRDTEGYYHLFRNGEELLPEIKKLETVSYRSGDGEYKDTKGEGHKVKGNNEEKELEEYFEYRLSKDE